jgi:hypothetical protein
MIFLQETVLSYRVDQKEVFQIHAFFYYSRYFSYGFFSSSSVHHTVTISYETKRRKKECGK